MRRRYALLGMTALLAAAIAVPAFGGSSNPGADTFASAKKTSKKALTKAKQANRKAKDAKKAANNAGGAAKTAQGAASDANSAAGSAQSSADAADAKAASAQSSANAAQVTADSKLGTVTNVDSGLAVVFSNSPQSATATCPSGTSPTGGGGSVGGTAATNGEVVITSSGPDGNGWKVTAREITPGTASSWSVFANRPVHRSIAGGWRPRS